MPVMTTAELVCNLPCFPELWDANDADEFAARIAVGEPQLTAIHTSKHSSISEFIGILMSERWNPKLEFPPGSVSIFDVNTVCVGELSLSLLYRVRKLIHSIISFERSDHRRGHHVSPPCQRIVLSACSCSLAGALGPNHKDYGHRGVDKSGHGCAWIGSLRPAAQNY